MRRRSLFVKLFADQTHSDHKRTCLQKNVQEINYKIIIFSR